MTQRRAMAAKVMLLGDIGVGKTSLARRLMFGRFEASYKTTIGVDILSHDLVLSPACGGAIMRLVLWDTDGDFGQAIFSTMYVAGAAGAIIVADASRLETFARMQALAETFQSRFPGRPVAAIVNKVDLVGFGAAPFPDEVSGTPVHRVSALTGEGVAPMFATMAETIWRRSN